MAFCDDPQAVLKAGYYALEDDGKELRHPLVRLKAVQPPDDVQHYYVLAEEDDDMTIGRIVPFEAQLAGHGTVAA